MKYLIMLITIIITFNACTMTTYHKINSNLEFEYLEKDQRKSYIVFGKESLFQLIEPDNSIITKEDSFEDEYTEIKEDIDPFESYNRLMTSFNDNLYTYILTPIAKGYKKVLHQNIRISISNFFHNITFPIRFINNILQFKFNNATEELGRFTLNSTIGILGFMDPAKKHFNLEKREEDFGQTLAYYGFGEGFHIVLPIYGPSNIRDILGLIGDSYIDPLSVDYKVVNRVEKGIAIMSFETTNNTSLNIGKYENLKKDAIDLYPFLKDIYTQNREKEIKE